MIPRSDRMEKVHSDIRGPLYEEALRMQKRGEKVLKLNTGNPGSFGFELPDSVRFALSQHIDEAVPYCDMRGMPFARDVICTYHIGRGITGIMPDDIFICNGVSEAASMAALLFAVEQQRLYRRGQACVLPLRSRQPLESRSRGYREQGDGQDQGHPGHQPQ